MNNIDLDKKIDGMTLGDLTSIMIAVVKEALKSDFEKIDKKFENMEKKFENMEKKFENMDKKLDDLEKEIRIVKYSQEVISYSNSSSISKPLDSFSTASLFGEPITVNSYDKL